LYIYIPQKYTDCMETENNPKPFKMVDPFNPQNVVEGLIYNSNTRYGDIWIQRVNGKLIEQYVHVTPKFLYPGDVQSPKSVKKGVFPSFNRIRVYNKIDGTNICMFRYYDKDYNIFTSYKTRLVPFLGKSAYGDWLILWNKMMLLYPDKLQKLVDNNAYNFGFEMYGAYNKILINYEVALDNRLLYAIDRESGMIIDPIDFDYPKPELLTEFENKVNPDEKYEEFRQKMEEAFKAGRPIEGCMLYIHCQDGTMKVWKCKPDSVLEIQVESNPKNVSYANAYATAINASESAKSLDDLLGETKTLLKEEYIDFFIEISMPQIKEAVSDAITFISLKNTVISVFKALNLTWKSDDKAQIKLIMNAMMKKFPNKRSTDIFNIIKAYGSIFQ
jgi:hypothetical protein